MRERTSSWGWVLAAVFSALALPNHVLAQTTGSIAGNVKDTTGAALPGVSVEVASPALIEKVRSTVTDGTGNYKITELRPGVYTVTFSLSGFSVVKREGIELSAGFTAPVNGELKVGSISETITVQGAAPVVDVQNVRTQTVLKQEVLDALPSSQRDTVALASLTLGAVATSPGRNDVGGDRGERSTGIGIHGSRGDDGRLNYDGMNTNVFYGGGGGQQRTYKFNTVMIAESVVDTGGNAADTETGGGNVNMVPKEGGNKFSMYGTANYTSKKLASGKVPSTLLARGSAPDQNSMKQVWDYGVGLGGPLKQDKLWFYTGHRWWGSQAYVANNYFNKSTNFFTYVPDLTRPSYVDIWTRDYGGRVTWQITSKQKLSVENHYQQSCGCWEGLGATSAPEASPAFLYTPHIFTQGTWTYPATNRLLFQAGTSLMRAQVQFLSKGGADVPGRLTVTDFNLPGVGFYTWGGGAQQFFPVIFDDGDPQRQDNFNWRVAMSYITGSHALKLGTSALRGTFNTRGHARSTPQGPDIGYQLVLFSGFPLQVVQYASPFKADGRINSQGIHASDQWTIKKMTLNLGVRWDHFVAGTNAIDVPAGAFIPARHYDAFTDIPNYNDITYRIGAAYDVFGNGKTAIRGSWGKYLVGLGGQQLISLAPSNSIIPTTTRPWNDFFFPVGDARRGNYVPDCDLKNFGNNAECGPIASAGFGSPIRAFTWDDKARKGWGIREYSNQWSVSVQQEVRAGFGVAAGFYHTEFHNTQIAVNTALSASSFDSFCVTAPTDPRLGPASGTRVCGNTDRTFASKPVVPNTVWYRVDDAPISGLSGGRKDFYNGGDVSLNWRFRQSGLLAGGLSLGKQVVDTCFANNFPQITSTVSAGSVTNLVIRDSKYCTTEARKLWNSIGSQVKFQVVYPLPADFVIAATYKHLPGIPQGGTVTYTNATVSAALGRNLFSCAAPTGACSNTVNIDVVQPGTLHDQRLNQVDIRMTRRFHIGRARLQGIAELYNALNMRVAQANTETWGVAAAPGAFVPGTTYLRPSQFLGGRLFKFGAQVDF